MDFEHPKKYKSRFGSNSNIYFDICEFEYSRSVQIESKYKQETNELSLLKLEDEGFESGIKTILFASLCLESAINDYAAWQLGDKYFQAHLEKLDVISKWVLIPKLVCGKSINKGGPAFSSLKKLTKSRNDLVHNKSKYLDLSKINDMKFHIEMENRNRVFVENVHNAYRALVFISLEMDDILEPEYNPLRSFDKKANVAIKTPDNIKNIINKCKSIYAQNKT